MAKQKNLEETVDSVINVAMERLKEIIDVNTVVGKPIKVDNNTTIIPISKVSAGFVAGGGELSVRNKKKTPKEPFAGGSGSGFSINPIGFLIIEKEGVKYVNCETKTPLDEIVKFSNNIVNKVINEKKEINNEKGN